MVALVTYLSSIIQRRSRPSNFKVLITSRPENELPRIRLRGEYKTESISRDVSILVQVNINLLQDAGLPHGLLTNLQKQLIK